MNHKLVKGAFGLQGQVLRPETSLLGAFRVFAIHTVAHSCSSPGGANARPGHPGYVLQCLGFSLGLGFRVCKLGFRVWGLGFGVWGLGVGGWGLGFRV